MSSPASRQRQRHRRRARERLWAAQKALTDREIDLASYERVIADMDKRYQDRKFSRNRFDALALVTGLRDTTKSECAKLQADVSILEIACQKLKLEEVSP